MTNQEAVEVLSRARSEANCLSRTIAAMAELCRNRLRHSDISVYVLADLKRELRDYNIHTGSWKDR